MMPDQIEHSLRAIDVMTAWVTDTTDGADNFTRDRFVENATAAGGTGFDLAVGLQNLAGFVLLKLERATRKPAQVHLQEFALYLESQRIG